MFKSKFKTQILSSLKELLTIIAIVVVIRSSIFTINLVPTGSMLPTIYLGDRLFVNRLAFGLVLPFMDKQIISWSTPERGDIVTFPHPQSAETYIKRIVGIAGDTINFDKGVLVVNGKHVSETVIDKPEVYAESNVNPEVFELFEERGLIENGATHYAFRMRFDYALQQKSRLDTANISPSDSKYAVPALFDQRVFRVPPGQLLCIGDNRDNSWDGRFWGFIDEKSVYGKALFITFSSVQSDPGLIPQLRFQRTFRPLSKLP